MVAEDIVNVVIDCAGVPSLVRHLQAPPPLKEGNTHPSPYEHVVEKASAFTLGLLAIKVIALPETITHILRKYITSLNM